jgi:hypothetical protein
MKQVAGRRGSRNRLHVSANGVPTTQKRENTRLPLLPATCFIDADIIAWKNCKFLFFDLLLSLSLGVVCFSFSVSLAPHSADTWSLISASSSSSDLFHRRGHGGLISYHYFYILLFTMIYLHPSNPFLQ